MASVIYNDAKRAVWEAELNFATADVRLRLLMTNTTADTENAGIVNIADLTTLDKHDGSNAVDAKALVNEAVNKDDGNLRVEMDADDPIFTALGDGTRAIQGGLIYIFVDGTDANDKVVGFVDFAADQNPGGSDFTINWDAEGIFQNA